MTTPLADATAPACVICHRTLWVEEQHRYACRPCTLRISGDLAAIPNLYAQLPTVLAPGSGNGGPAVSGSRTAPLPLRLEPLSLSARGGVVTVLQTWLADWHEALAYRHPRWQGGLQEQCEQVVARLQLLLPWAAEEHPAMKEFADEVRDLRGACERQITGEPRARRIHVTCPCGRTLAITVDTLGRECGCGQRYARGELFDLPLADRRQVAA
ncbi:hypothetical protein [Streptomyces sp. NRRL F-5630]|uniref:hypothetical protein n=1 Tax=Streptomyces sp. NRRL F-5630 TaxID=1463864 RepID=UPI003D75F1A1